MNRSEFISSILKYLKRIPQEEKQEVERYYNEIFDDANIGLEDEIPNSYGEPKTIALEILSGLGNQFREESPQLGSEKNEYSKNNNSKKYSILIIILAILAAPVGLPLAFALGITFVALLFAFGALIFGLSIGAVSIVYSVIYSQVPLLTKISGIGVVLILFGLAILTIELFRYTIGKISNYISRKIRERRASHENTY